MPELLYLIPLSLAIFRSKQDGNFHVHRVRIRGWHSVTFPNPSHLLYIQVMREPLGLMESCP